MNASAPRTGGSRRALTVIAAVLLLCSATWFSAAAVVPQLRSEWHLSSPAAAWLTIAVQLGFVAGAVASSALNLADVFPPRLVILGSAAGAAATNLALALAHGPGLAIPLRLLNGVFLAGVYPPTIKLTATWFDRSKRGRGLGILVGASAIGSALPHLVNAAGGLDWHAVVYGTSALSLAGGVLALYGLREGPFRFPAAVFDPRQAGVVFANRGVRLASLAYFGHMWELYAMWTWFLLFFSSALGAHGGTSRAALATFAVIGIGALGSWAGGVAGDRWGRPETAIAMMTGSAACALLVGLLLSAPAWIVLVVGLVWGFTVLGDSAQFSTLVTDFADQSYVGTALALQTALGFGLTTATIWLVPRLEDAFGWRWAFAFLAPGPLLGIVAMARLRATTA
jgi:MFS family permease